MITTDDKNTPDEREMSNMSDRDLFLVMIKDIEKRLSTVGLAFKGVNELLKRYGERLDSLEKIKQPQEQVIIKAPDNKPTRYYPNGAYMDEPVFKSEYYFINPSGVYSDDWISTPTDYEYLQYANCFPTEEAAEKELKRQNLTAKMYRDMRDERINGDWDINFEDRLKLNEEKFYPYLENLEENRIDYIETYTVNFPHNFYYKNETFIEDLKRSFAWTEEELKIVWFGV